MQGREKLPTSWQQGNRGNKIGKGPRYKISLSRLLVIQNE
jgi:hypothetical protein